MKRIPSLMPAGLKIFQHDPDVRTVRNALYVPSTPGHPDDYFGLFDQYGRMISEGAYFRTRTSLCYQTPISKISSTAGHGTADASVDYVYLGALGSHYGHFVASSLSRFWADPELYRKARLVVHFSEPPTRILEAEWFRFYIEALGLDIRQFIVFNRPTIIPQIAVPSPAFGEEHYAHAAFHRLTLGIGARMRSSPPFGDKIYLSKTGLKRGVWTYAGEEVIEATLAKAGFDIVHPQTIGLADQMSLFADERMVVGISGSAFHNSVFTSAARGLVLSQWDHYSGNFHLMDAVSDARIDYYQMDASAEDVASVDGFAGAARIRDPAAVAEQIIELSRDPSDMPRGDGERPAWLYQGARMTARSAHGTWLVIDECRGMLCHVADLSDSRFVLCELRVEDGRVVIRHPSGNYPIWPSEAASQSRQIQFNLQTGPEGTAWLKETDTGFYLTAELNGQVTCRAQHAGGWEGFTLESVAE